MVTRRGVAEGPTTRTAIFKGTGCHIQGAPKGASLFFTLFRSGWGSDKTFSANKRPEMVCLVNNTYCDVTSPFESR